MNRGIFTFGWIAIAVLILIGGFWIGFDSDQTRINAEFGDCQREWLQSQVPDLLECRDAPHYTCTLNAEEYSRYRNVRAQGTVQCVNIDLTVQ